VKKAAARAACDAQTEPIIGSKARLQRGTKVLSRLSAFEPLPEGPLMQPPTVTEIRHRDVFGFCVIPSPYFGSISRFSTRLAFSAAPSPPPPPCLLNVCAAMLHWHRTAELSSAANHEPQEASGGRPGVA
jgi:hypothetical protein